MVFFEIPGYRTAFWQWIASFRHPFSRFPGYRWPASRQSPDAEQDRLVFLLQTHIIVTSNTEKEKKTAQVGMEERITMEENHDKDTREDPEPLTDEEFERFQNNIQKKGLLQKHKNLQQPHSYV